MSRETRGTRTEEHSTAQAVAGSKYPALSDRTTTESPSRSEIERFARWLIANGVEIAWTFQRGKKDGDKKKLDERFPREVLAATAYLTTKLQRANIILPAAASSLFLVDGDTPEIVQAAREIIGAPTFEILTGSGKTNLVARAPEGVETHVLRFKQGDERRLEAVKDGYLVAPLSVHPDTGELYVQTNELAPVELTREQVAALAALPRTLGLDGAPAPSPSPASPESGSSELRDAAGAERKDDSELPRHELANRVAAREWRHESEVTPETSRAVLERVRPVVLEHHPERPYSDRELSKYVREAAEFAVTESFLGADIAEPSSKPNEKPTLRSSLVRLVDVEERPVRFAVRPYFQRGSFHVLAARKGAGKGTWLSYIAAGITRGDYGPKRRVVWVSSEDSASMDLKPRLAVAGADLGYVETPEGFWLELPRDIHAEGGLRDVLLGFGDVGLLVVDPLGNHITGKDSNAESDIRSAIAPLNDLADETDTVVVGIRHETEKAIRDGAGFLAGILGSSAFVQVPRVVIGIAEDDVEDDVRHVAVARGNRLPKGEAGERFRIEGVPRDGHELDIPRAVLLGESSKSLDELVRNGQASKSKLAREAFLEELAANDGAMESDALDERVADRISGLTDGTRRKIRSKMSKDGLIRSEQVRDGDEWGAPLSWRVVLTSAGIAALGIDSVEDSHV